MYLPPSAKSTNFKWESQILSSIDNDPLDNLVTLSMPCESIYDEKGHTITIVNSDYPPVINIGNSRDGTGCLSLIGDGVNTNSTYCYLIGNEFLIDDSVNSCIEFWTKFNAIPANTKLISNQSGDYTNWSVEVNGTNNIQLVCGNSTGNTQIVIFDSNTLELNIWKHHAFIKIDKAWKYFLNGIEQRYSQYTINMGYVPVLQSNVVLNMNFNSKISDDSGKAITVIGNSQLSTSIKKYGNSSLFLNGGYITTQSMDIVQNEDFTLEFWVYPLNISSNTALIMGIGNRSGVMFNSGGNILWLGEDITTTGTLIINSWNHIAISRTTNIITLFLNGNAIGTGTSTQAQSLNSFGNNVYGQQLNGYLDDVRITRGLGKYNTNFTPIELQYPVTSTYRLNIGKPSPTYTVKYVTLGLNMEGVDGSTSIIDSTGKTISVAGNTNIKTSKFKYGTSSVYFDGSGDYLFADNKGIAAFGLNTFTVEVWVYLLSYGGGGYSDYSGTIFDSRTSGGDTGGLLVITTTSGTLILHSIATGTIVLPLNTWVHIAVSRDSGYIRTFVNGIKDIEITNTTNYTGDMVTIGNVVDGRTNNTYLKFYGYMDNLFVFSGIGKYTSNFTPTEPIEYFRPLMYLDDIRITINSNRYLTNFSLDDSKRYLFTKSGIVYDKSGIPSKRLIRLYNRKTGNLVNETFSDEMTGMWSLTTPYPDTHFVVAHDNTGAINTSIIIDRV